MTFRLVTTPDRVLEARAVARRLFSVGVDVAVEGARAEGGRNGHGPVDALAEGRADLAVVDALALRGAGAPRPSAVLPRAEAHEVLVCAGDDPMPLRAHRPGTRVAVTDARRRAYLRAHRPDLEAVDVEGPADAAALLGSGSVRAAVLSAAAARRIGLGRAISEMLDPKAWLPGAGQGVTCVLTGGHPTLDRALDALDHAPTRAAIAAELALLSRLGAPDDAPIGAHAQPSPRWMRLWAGAVSLDGRRLVRSDCTGVATDPEELAARVARELVERGVATVLAGAPA